VKSGRLALDGVLPVAAFASHLALRLGIPTALTVVLARRHIRGLLARCRDVSVATPILLTLAPAIVALAYYATILHEMGEFHRFAYPTYYYFAVAAAAVMTACSRSLDAQEARAGLPGTPRPVPAGRSRATIAVGALACLVAAVAIDRPWQLGPRALGPYFLFGERIANALRDTGLGERGVVLCDSAGLIPYASDFRHVDRVGLVDNRLSGRSPMTMDERERYMWTQRLDVYIGFEPPASPGVERASDDPRLQGRYGSALLRPWFGEVMKRILLDDADLLHRRMRELRDRWIWIGDLGLPGAERHGLKAFAYVRQDSPYVEVLRTELEEIVVRSADRIDLAALDAR
jgi:hypothetical protein